MNHLFLPAALLALAIPATAQSWTQLTPQNSPPAQGYTPSPAFHFATGKIVMYGGRTSASLADTWTFNGNDWTQESPANDPGPRWGHKMVQRIASGQVILFGGRDAGTTALNETWAWNGLDWTQIQTANAPSPRAWHVMAYDSRRDAVVVFGGFAVLDGATWEFDGTDWRAVTTASRPPIAGDGQMVYDESRGVCVLFGGWDGRAAVYAGTWEYDGRDWRQVQTTNTPPLRQWHQMSYDPLRRHVVMHGGWGSSALSDAWTFDGSDWTQVSPVGAAPSVPLQGGMTYDYIRDTHVNFGGRGPGGTSGDTHDYRSAAYPSYAMAGAGCAGSAGVPLLEAVAGSVPRSGATLNAVVSNVPASTSSVVVLFGLSNASFAGSRLPFDLDVLGMTGCYLDCSADVAFAIPAAGGSATFSLAIPASLTDFVFWNQMFVPDTAAAGGAVLSNGCRAFVTP